MQISLLLRKLAMDNDQNNNNLIAVLETKVEDLRFMISTQLQNESKAIKWFSIVGVAITAIFIGLQGMTYYQVNQSSERIEQRAQSVLDRTEARLDELIGKAIPFSTWADNIYSDGSKVITGSAWIYRSGNKDDDMATYKLEIRIPAKIFVDGITSGKLLGYEVRYTEDFPNILYSDLDREAREEFKRQKMTYSYSNIGNEGVMISPKAGINFSISEIQTRLDCNVVEQKLRKLADAKNVGTITIRPVLQKASPEINVKENEFSLRFVSSSLFNCKGISNIEKNDSLSEL